MSCMNNIDPYNNAPPSKNGKGGCSSGKCGASQPPPQQMQQQFGAPQPQMGGRDLQAENQMLFSDLQVAVNYIRQLGGTWPPPHSPQQRF